MFENMRWDADVVLSPVRRASDGERASLELSYYLDGERHATMTDRPIIKIGSLKSSHVRIEHDSVSRMHAVIEYDSPYHIDIIDLASRRGTLVNDQRIDKATISPDDRVKIGDAPLNFLVIHPATTSPTDTRQCLGCQKPMAVMHIGEIYVDVCADHGIWFDREELQQVLQRAAE